MQQITRPHFNISALGCFAHRTMCVTAFTAAQWKEIYTNLRFVGTHSSLGFDLQNQSCIVIAMKVDGWEKRKLATDSWKSLEVFHLCSLEG
jgi:hypothetical protein